MTMYQEFLELALDELDRRHDDLGGPDLEAAALNDVAATRQALSELGRESDPSGAITANVDYDAALILLARARGIECDLAAFSRPKAAREELEASLRAGGGESR